MPREFDVVIERDVASVPQIRGCHSQARSLDEVAERIREAVSLCLEVEGTPPWPWRHGRTPRVTDGELRDLCGGRQIFGADREAAWKGGPGVSTFFRRQQR